MMTLSRRRALFGLLAAPAIIRTAGLLMPVRPAPVFTAIVTVTPSDFAIDAARFLLLTSDGEREFVVSRKQLMELGQGAEIILGKLDAGVTVNGIILPVDVSRATASISVGAAPRT